jgi:hypothetical protein
MAASKMNSKARGMMIELFLFAMKNIADYVDFITANRHF